MAQYHQQPTITRAGDDDFSGQQLDKVLTAIFADDLPAAKAELALLHDAGAGTWPERIRRARRGELVFG